MTSVLICDDSLVARKQAAKCLPDDWNVNINFAKNGKEGVAALHDGKGDLLLLDLNMPVMDGYEVLEHIQKDQLEVKVIVISGDIQPEAHTRVKELGALAFIEKPVDKQQLKTILQDLDLITKTEAPKSSVNELDPDIRDCYQEITNIAMGQAGDRLARILNVFVKLPIPSVNLIETSEIHMALQEIAIKESVSAVTQGFVGAGVAGEALLIFNDASFSDVAKLLNYPGDIDDHTQLEVMMDGASILIGACLNGIAEQLDLNFSQGHPVILGQHQSIKDLIKSSQHNWKKTLTIEISYSIENYNIHCDLLLLFTEDSMQMMNKKLMHLLED